MERPVNDGVGGPAPLSTELVMELLGFSHAYPEDQFPPLTKAEVMELPRGVLDRASAAMGRHVSKFTKKAADEIERQAKEIERLRAAMTQACSDMGCYCADDDPLPENLKCPMCKLEKALHG